MNSVGKDGLLVLISQKPKREPKREPKEPGENDKVKKTKEEREAARALKLKLKEEEEQQRWRWYKERVCVCVCVFVCERVREMLLISCVDILSGVLLSHVARLLQKKQYCPVCFLSATCVPPVAS